MAAVAGTTAKRKMRLGVKIALHSVGAGCILCGAFLGASVWDLNRRVNRAARCLSDESSVERSRYIVPPDSVAAALSAAQRDPGEPRSLSYRKWSQFPFVLLRLAQCDNRKLKQLAFRRLLNSKAMTNADFCQIAQSANFKTLLELARFLDADPRFFLQPRQPNYAAARGGNGPHFDDYGHSDSPLESFEDRLRDLLKMLLTVDLPPIKLQQPQPIQPPTVVENSQSLPWYNFATSFLSGSSSSTNVSAQDPEHTSIPGQCRCCRYRTQLALDRTEPENHFLEHEGFVGTELPDASRRDPLSNEEARIAVLLEALRVQSAHSDRARRMMNANTTLVLRDLLLATSSAELHRVVARIMLNLTAAFRCARDESGMRELVRHIAEGRWLSILHHWFRESDPYLSLYAANALTNLSAIVTHLETVSDLKEPLNDATAAPPGATNCVMDLYRDGLYLLYPLQSTLKDLDSSVSLRHEVTARAAKWLRETLAKFGFKVHLAMVHASSTVPHSNGDADIVFVHGLLGGVLRTWRARECPDLRKQLQSASVSQNAIERLSERGTAVPGSEATFELHANSESEAGDKRSWRRNTPCWPKDWLPTDLPNVRVIGLDYDTNLSRWQRACPYDEERNTLEARAATILKQLQRAGVGRDRPVIWIGHSLGGLLVKQILVLASKRRVSGENEFCESLVRNTKGCVFYAVPHLGTDFAKLFTRYNMLLSLTTEVEQLSNDSRYLDTLNAEFRKLILKEDIAQIGTPDGSAPQRSADECKPNILSFVERDELALWKYKALIVPQHTADAGLGGEHLLVPEDHQRVCKPASPDSPNYAEVVRFIKKCLLLS